MTQPNTETQPTKSEAQTNPLHADRGDTLEAAVSKLLKEPEPVSENLEEEPEDTAEPLEDEELASEEEEDEDPQPLDEDEGEEEDEEGNEEGEEELYYTVKVDGEELEVSLDELQSGYQRQKDYTKKTQALSEQRKAYEAKQAEIETLQTQYIQQVQMANQLLNRDLEKYRTVDWNAMKVEDPVGYLQKQIEVRDIQEQQAALRQQAQAFYEQDQQRQAEEKNQYLELQRKEALTLFPDWKNPEKANAHRQQMFEYGRSLGYSDEQLGNVTTAMDLVLLDKAMKYDALQATKKGIAKKATTPAIRKVVKTKGIAPKGANKAKVQAEKSEALRKSGSLKDAAALMMEMRSGKSVKKSFR